ncbi:MAG TPA: SagB family peptide dehydrogenase [Candidatus Dormibacteraeota bacterium]
MSTHGTHGWTPLSSDDGARTLEDARYRRAPALLVEWQGQRTVVIDCTTLHRVAIDPDLVRVLARLDRWTTIDEMRAAGCRVEGGVLERLVASGLVESRPLGEGSATEHEEGDPRMLWNPFDLAVQRNANRGGLRERPAIEPEVELRGARSSVTTIPLPPPVAALPAALGDVLQRRRSVRRFGSRALRLDELSTLLHHAARVESPRPAEQQSSEAHRPFPAAGAESELEIYVLADNVDGLTPAAYHYDPVGHHLVLVRARDADQERIQRDAGLAAGGLERTPPVMLLITAVFSRVMQRYEWVGLSLIYKDCGCLLQTLYLVATAMGLAPCAIGTGEELENTRWLGLDPLVEAQVGCFLVGPRLSPDT